MQCFIIFFIIVYALHVSGGFSAHHQELKNSTHSIRYVPGTYRMLCGWCVGCWLYLKEYRTPVYSSLSVIQIPGHFEHLWASCNLSVFA